MKKRAHNVAIRVGGHVIENWTGYEVESNMLEPADGFDLTLGKPTRQVWDLCKPDSFVQVLIDDTIVMSGTLDDRDWSDERSATSLTVRGRDGGGRLVDESMPLIRFSSLTIKGLAEKVIGLGEEVQWFDEAVLSNAENRRLIRGPSAPTLKARKARAAAETRIADAAVQQAPRTAAAQAAAAADFAARQRAYLEADAAVRLAASKDGRESSPRRVEPGQSRWQVLEHFLQKYHLLAWPTADGSALYVGLPNYDQEPAYHFFQPAERSDRQAEGNLLSCKIRESVGDRYSEITVVGTPRDADGQGVERVNRRGVAVNGPFTHGTGKDFSSPKRLLVVDDDIKGSRDAELRARREMAIRDAAGHTVEITVAGHSQVWDGQRSAIYAFDTMARFEHEETGIAGEYMLTCVKFAEDRQQGEITRISLVPKGTVLTS